MEIHNRIDRTLIPDHVPMEMVEDFRNHMWACFKYLGIPGGEPTPYQYAMGEALQEFENDMQLQAGRGAGKSTITGMLGSWFLLRDPNANVMILSATGLKAIQFMSEIRKIITHVPYCHHLLPQINTLDNATSFNVGAMTIHGRQDPSCFAKGITSQITGSHADYVIVDDVEIEGNCETPAQREKLLHKLTELEQIRNEGGRIIFLGTPQTIDSIYFKLAEHYKVIKFPAVMPDKDSAEETLDVAPYILGLNLEPLEPTHPERFNREALERRLARSGQTQFDLHYRLLTGSADRNKFPLRLRDLIVLDVSTEMFPERIIWSSTKHPDPPSSFGVRGDYFTQPQFISDRYVKYQDRALFIDPAGTGEDEVGMCMVSFVNGYVIVHEMLGMETGYEEPTMTKVVELCKTYDCRKIRVEDNFGAGMFRQLLLPYLSRHLGGVDLDGFSAKGQKDQRICDTLEPTMNCHRLVFNRDAIAVKENQIQLTRIQRRRGSLKMYDRVDCLANAIKYWNDVMSISAESVEAQRVDQEFEKIYKDYLRSGRGWGDLDKNPYVVTTPVVDKLGFDQSHSIFDLRRARRI